MQPDKIPPSRPVTTSAGSQYPLFSNITSLRAHRHTPDPSYRSQTDPSTSILGKVCHASPRPPSSAPCPTCHLTSPGGMDAFTSSTSVTADLGIVTHPAASLQEAVSPSCGIFGPDPLAPHSAVALALLIRPHGPRSSGFD
ncbi:hypothetical protein CGRA01v4_14783 [Colletotrichum graminicola]|nr:hypothetical protein CGRA01v4_14783 [Colletotrichum graminicola]